MTGLDPEKDRILELAAIATNWKLEKIAELTAVQKVATSLMEERMRTEFWEKNAATKEALMRQNTEGQEPSEVEKRLLDFVAKNFGKEVILAGNSIHQDRKFIDKEWPKLAEKLHYRMLDVSAWKVYFEGALGKKFLKKEQHRALDDINGSIEELKWYKGFLNAK